MSRELPTATATQDITTADIPTIDTPAPLNFQGQATQRRSIPDGQTTLPQSNTPTASGISAAGQPAIRKSVVEPIAERKKGLSNKERTPSLDVNRRTQRAQNAQGEKGTIPASNERQQPAKSKKKGLARFLALLNCCGAPDDGNAINDDKAEPSKRIPPLKSTQTTQPMTANKPTDSQTESGTADSKERLEEDSGAQHIHQDTTIVSEEHLQASRPITAPIAERSMPNLPAQEVIPLSEKPLPASPAAVSTGPAPYHMSSTPAFAAHEQTTTNSPQVTISAPTPVVTETAVSEEEDQVISDRTPEQARKDEDIEMTDAGPSLPLASSEVSKVQSEVAPAPTARPLMNRGSTPSAPLPSERHAHTTSATKRHAQQTTVTSVPPAEPQMWLLPPIKAEMRGRKCLVLDLDETLVHSSFKVGAWNIV